TQRDKRSWIGVGTPHKLSINLIEMEGEVYLWRTRMTREIRPNPLGSRPDSKVDSRADNKGNPINRPANAHARCVPVGRCSLGAAWLAAARPRPQYSRPA